MSTYTPIATQTLSSAAASVTFSSIPQGYTDLIVVSNIIPSTSLSVNMSVGNNSLDTGTNYSCTRLFGNGTTASSDRSSSTANSFGNWGIGGGPSAGAIFVTQLQNYSSATTYKTFLTRVSDMTAGYVGSLVSLWRSTSAINILSITGSSNFASGSTFSIYGIAGGQIGTKATGGIVSTDATYAYHAFTSSGSFVPSAALTADILIVAGGGSGGAGTSAGGGAGGVVYATSASLSSMAYPVVVGAGGAAGRFAVGQGFSGSNSTFSNFAALGGGAGNCGPFTLGTISGGSGGGGGEGVAGGTATQGSGTGYTGYGNAGGGGNNTSPYLHGGGGGAGAAGNGGTGISNGNGGAGLNTWSSWLSATGLGVAGYIAGGGGGGGASTAGAGGAGGGGAGSGTTSPGSGVVNTGGGGGGLNSGTNPASGGSGLVIIRYAL